MGYTSESKLRREFESYGPIKQIKMISDQKTGKPRGYCFIEFEQEKDMHSAYKHADGKKIDGRRVLVDVERARTVKGWLPRRLGGGLGGTRRGGPDVNVRHSGREEHRDRERGGGGGGSDRDRGDRRRRSRTRSRDRKRDRKRSRSRSPKRRRRSRTRSRDRKRSRSRDRKRDRKEKRSRSRDREDRRDRRRDRVKMREENLESESRMNQRITNFSDKKMITTMTMLLRSKLNNWTTRIASHSLQMAPK